MTSKMTSTSKYSNTPGGRSTRRAATRHSDSGESRVVLNESERSGKLPRNTHTYIGTLNIQTLIQAGKLHNLTTELKKQRIQILALQETRFTDSDAMDYEGYRFFKSGTDKRIGKNTALLGMAFAVDMKILDSVKDVKAINNRLMTMELRHTNKKYTVINVHAPTNADNKDRPEETNKFWETLETVMTKIPQDHTKILLGDFNAQIGKEKRYRKTVGEFPAHKFTNKNGMRFIELCQQNNLKIMSTSLTKKPKKQKTWRSPIHHLGEFQIDHVAISYDQQKEIHDVQVRRGANIDSDHYLTRIKIKMTPRRRYKKQPTSPKFDNKKIEKSGITEKWDMIEAQNWDAFRNKITTIAKELIPLTKKPKHPWWNDTCEDILQKRKTAFLNYNNSKTEIKHKIFLDQRRQTAKIIRQEKRRYVNEQLNSIEEDFRKYNTRDFYKTFASQIKGYTPQNLCFKKKNGKLALTNKENCEELAGYFSTLLNCTEPGARFLSQDPRLSHKDSPPPDKDEILTYIKRLKNNKAAGEDGITAELLKNLGPKSLDEITKIIQEIWKTEIIPDDWKTALVHPLHKKGSKTDVNNYRGISLLPVTYKILSMCLLTRTQKQLEPDIAEYQAGFRPGRSCPEQIFNLKSILRLHAKNAKHMTCTFVDFKKAYDSIDRKSLFEILRGKGLDNKTQRLIEQTLTNTKSKIKFKGEVSEPFEIKTGVRQGDGLSPLLFNIVLDRVMEEWEKEVKNRGAWKPVKIGYTLHIPYLAFADDLVLLTYDHETAKTQIETLQECAGKVGLQISLEKTQIMTRTGKDLDTRYGKIKGVTNFRYLGEIIEPTGTENMAYKDRQAKVRKALGMVQSIYNKKCLSKQTKIRHMNTVIKPAILYASETLALNRKLKIEEIKKEDRKLVRKILGARLTTEGYRLQKNSVVEEHSNIETDMRKRRMKFYGHLDRLPHKRLTKQILEQLKSLKKSITWMEEVRKDLKAIGTGTMNRDDYREHVNKWVINTEAPKKQYRPKWTEERKAEFSRRMREYWKDKKNKK